MAHVGKLYPYSADKDFCIQQLPHWIQPRKWYYFSQNLFNLGTLAAPWRGQNIQSSLGETDYTLGKITYTYNHPTVVDNFILHIVDFPEVGGAGPLQETFCTRYRFEFWYGGTRYGTHTVQTRIEFVQVYPTVTYEWDEWQDLVNPSLFRAIGRSRVSASTWEQQPEYHPYRYIS